MGENLKIAKKAETFVQQYFRQKRHTDLVKAPRSEIGYDFRDQDGNLFVEVKGTASKELSQVLFTNFTNSEYEKARNCRKTKKKYEIHLVTGVGTERKEHYKIPGNELVDNGKPEISWYLPIRKAHAKFRVND